MVYVASDIHGNLEGYLKLMDVVQPNDTLYLIGDVVDRGQYGIEILRDVMKRENIRFLLGNHELMLIDCYEAKDSPYFKMEQQLWVRNGGQATMDAFGNLSEEEQAEVILYLLVAPLSADVRVNDVSYYLVHGHPPIGDLSGSEHRDICLWGRVEPIEPLYADKVTIFGHTPTNHYQPALPMSIWYGDNRIGIDCGCGWPSRGGRLGCLCLDTMEEIYV